MQVHEVVEDEVLSYTFMPWNAASLALLRVKMSDALLREFRHRYNHRVSERRRLGFPKIGHYDTWSIDKLQLLVEKNHNVLLYPWWSNTSNFATTKESFCTVPMHSKKLGAR